jgi:hypothetical protein
MHCLPEGLRLQQECLLVELHQCLKLPAFRFSQTPCLLAVEQGAEPFVLFNWQLS